MATRPATRNYVAEPADLPRGTLVQLFFEAIDRYGRPDAQRHKVGAEWRDISHAEIEKRVRRIALAMDVLGLQPGDRVAILSENRPEWAHADYAALCFGTPDVPVYATLPAPQIRYILEDSGARLVFVSTAEQYAKIQEIRSELPALEHVVLFDAVPGADGPGVLTLADMMELGRREEEAGRGADFRERALSHSPDDVATVLYTSGTTGQPKGVVLTHDNIYSNTQSIDRIIKITSEDNSLSFLPLSHILQRMVDYMFFWKGVSIAYVARIENAADALAEIRPTVAVSVPRLYEKIYAKVLSATGFKRVLVLWARRTGLEWVEPILEGRKPPLGVRIRHAIADRLVFSKLRARTGGRIRFFISGGAPLNPVIARFFRSAGLLILEGYGLTETSPVTNVNTLEDMRIGTVGKPIPGTEEMIAEDGEILIRGPQVMKGYFNNPEATAEAIEDGWFHTGDIGSFDEDGFLRITDRKKDLLVTAGGKNIAPQPIENAAKTSRFVAEAILLGDRRPYPIMLLIPNFEFMQRWGELHDISWPSQEAMTADPRVLARIVEDVAPRLEGFARYEKPKKYALLPRELELEREEITPTLKVRRRVVERNFREVIERLYGEAEVPAE